MDMARVECAALQAQMGEESVTRTGDTVLVLDHASKTYEEAYRSWYHATTQVARRESGYKLTREESEDVAQTAWVDVWRNWTKIAQSAALSQWSYVRTTTERRTIDALRRRRLRAYPVRLTEEVREAMEATCADSPRYEPEQIAQERDTLQRAVAYLAERYSRPVDRRTRIILSCLLHLGESDTHAISAILKQHGYGTSPNCVKASVSRLYKELRATAREIVTDTHTHTKQEVA